MTPLFQHLVVALGLTEALATSLGASGLSARNGSARSNTIGSQLWCVVGARESYTRAIESGSWGGFSCSLEQPHSPDAVAASLASSQRPILELAEGRDQLTEAQENYLLGLLEHEVQHHGQLIRFFYANGFPFPTAFESHYSLG